MWPCLILYVDSLWWVFELGLLPMESSPQCPLGLLFYGCGNKCDHKLGGAKQQKWILSRSWIRSWKSLCWPKCSSLWRLKMPVPFGLFWLLGPGDAPCSCTTDPWISTHTGSSSFWVSVLCSSASSEVLDLRSKRWVRNDHISKPLTQIYLQRLLFQIR